MNLTVPVVPILVPTKKREKPTLFCKCCAKLWKSWATEFCELTLLAVVKTKGSSVYSMRQKTENYAYLHNRKGTLCVCALTCVSVFSQFDSVCIPQEHDLQTHSVFCFTHCTFLYPLRAWNTLPIHSRKNLRCWGRHDRAHTWKRLQALSLEKLCSSSAAQKGVTWLKCSTGCLAFGKNRQYVLTWVIFVFLNVCFKYHKHASLLG